MNFILGVTNQGDIVFGEYNLYKRNQFIDGTQKKYTEFAANFDVVKPFIATEKFLRDRAEGYVEMLQSDVELAYDFCETHDCSPSEMIDVVSSKYDFSDLVDISLYPASFRIGGVEGDIYFESVACGQHDTRETGMARYVNKEFYDLLHELWDEYHLKPIPHDKIQQLEDMYHQVYDNLIDDDYVKSYLEELYGEGE